LRKRLLYSSVKRATEKIPRTFNEKENGKAFHLVLNVRSSAEKKSQQESARKLKPEHFGFGILERKRLSERRSLRGKVPRTTRIAFNRKGKNSRANEENFKREHSSTSSKKGT